MRRVQVERVLAVVGTRRRLPAMHVHGSRRRALRAGVLRHRPSPGAGLRVPPAAQRGRRDRARQRPRGRRRRRPAASDGGGRRPGSGRPVGARPVLDRALAGRRREPAASVRRRGPLRRSVGGSGGRDDELRRRQRGQGRRSCVFIWVRTHPLYYELGPDRHWSHPLFEMNYQLLSNSVL